ncbi:MAG: PBP1A family penicillin-binding protein [bacterium]|nr:PBP1A family penicillin-binding protein [bacterium]
MRRIDFDKTSVLIGFAKFISFTLIVLTLTGTAFFWWFDRNYADDLRTTLNQKSPTITLLADDGHVLAKRGIRHAGISLGALPQSLIDAVLSTEDRRFFSHWGLDPQGLGRAIWNNLSKGRLREGGSTITQQLVKNVFLTRKRTLTRKLRELVISLWLEQHYSKEQILELYFNRVYFGAGASHGITAAARRYFDKSPTNLDLAESALLAGLLKAPSYYSPSKNLARAHQRAFVVLDNMVATGAISRAQAKFAEDQPARLNKPARAKSRTIGTEYALDWIMEQLKDRVGRIETDLIVKTTLNFNWQVLAQKLVRKMIETNRQEKNIDQAAAVLLDEAGGIKLMIGGTSYEHSQFNRVTQAHRQPGSSFKPVVFLAAMESGRSPNSIEMDERIKIEGWRPRNYARFHRGPVTLRKALAGSINSIAAKLADDVGLEKVIQTAKRLGIHSRLNKRPSLALGSSEVTPLEMTGAYVPFMNGGFRAPPHVIKEVITTHDELVYEYRDPHHVRIVEPAYIYDMNDMLGAVMRTGTGKRARLDNHASAGKTGTTQSYRDAWFIGYSGYFTCGIWAGNDNNTPTNGVSGGKLPAILWKQIMQLAHQGRPPRPLPGLGTNNIATAQALILDEQLPLEEIIMAVQPDLPEAMIEEPVIEPVSRKADSDNGP